MEILLFVTGYRGNKVPKVTVSSNRKYGYVSTIVNAVAIIMKM